MVYTKEMGPAVASPSFLVIKTDVAVVLPGYLAWYLNHPDVTRELKDIGNGYQY
ncbi:MAG: hypothetical protein V8S95_13225 [Odoribacter sp.]